MNKLIVISGLSCFIFFSMAFEAPQSFGIGINYIDSLEADRAMHIARINEAIKGKENVAVDSVFKNLKVLGGFPAENLVFAMEAWSKALSVSCNHCHNTSDFSLDEKEKKEIARQMVEMGNLISSKLKSVKGLSTRPIVNCYTCHRGELKPAYRITGK